MCVDAQIPNMQIYSHFRDRNGPSIKSGNTIMSQRKICVYKHLFWGGFDVVWGLLLWFLVVCGDSMDLT